MKWLGLVVVMLLSLNGACHPIDSARLAEREARAIVREKAKIEREKKRIERKWDERSRLQKKADRRALIFLVISAAVLVNAVAVKE